MALQLLYRTRMSNALSRLGQAALLVGILTPSLASAQNSSPKLDETLRETVERGCSGTQSVIIRTKPGYRQGLHASLTAHGDAVTGEFPALDAMTATVHCEDLSKLAGFDSTSSISVNGPISGQALPSIQVLQDEVTTATNTVGAAKSAADAAQLNLSLAVSAQTTALSIEQAAVIKLGNAKPGDLAKAQADLAVAEASLAAARERVVVTTAKLHAAQVNLAQARQALAVAQQQLQRLTDRIAEGKAAGQLQKQFFNTLGVRARGTDSLGSPVKGKHSNDTPLRALLDVNHQVQSTDGSGRDSVGVAVIDSGIEPGQDFGDRITAFYDFTNGDIRSVAASDGYGHGTHVAGLIASRYVGVDPNARLIGLQVLDAQGKGTTGNVVRAIEFAIANKTILNIQVLNVSLGHPIFEPAATDPLVQAVEHAVRVGLTVVVSAGNYGVNPRTRLGGYAGIASPGNAPSAISVGAVRTFNTVSRDDDRIARYSSRGPSWYDGFAKPDLSAPGDNLLSVAAAGSTLRLAQEARGNVGDYMRLSGTSMAAGVTSGLVALVLQSNSGLTPNALKAVLEYSSIQVRDDAGAPYDALTQGAGDINGAGALALARNIDPTARVGQHWLSSSIVPTSVLGGTSYTWSQEVIWGNHIAHGTGILTEQRPAWALAIVWGDGLDLDDNIVWGNSYDDLDNIVWGNTFDEGDNIVWGNSIVWASSLAIDNRIVWSSLDDDNIVWGNHVVWGSGLIGLLDDDNIVWGNLLDDDNIVWGNLDDDNIVWGNLFDDNIVWGNSDDDNIVWGNADGLGGVLQSSGTAVGVNASNARARRTLSHVKGVQ
jgi:serine protease AprX